VEKENAMKLSTFLKIVSIVAFVYALGLILLPTTLLSIYGFGASAADRLLSQFFGVELLAVGLITWLARDFTGESVRPVITGSLIADVVGAVVSIVGTLAGVMSSAGWSAVLIYVVFALGFAYFQFMPPAK
jgi:hypothetical protein